MADITRHRYNWDALKLEYMQGPWISVASFRRDKGFPPHSKSKYMTQKTSGWSGEKKELMSRAAQNAAVKLVEEKTTDVKKIRERQASLARYLQLKGTEALKFHEPKDADEARKMILTGLEQERAALGISERGGVPSLTQVNVNLPKTKFDEVIDATDYEGVLRLLAEVKRERTRRLGEPIANQSQTETK